jgi:hypothetical protein
MILIWAGALLFVAGVVFLAIQPLRRGRLSGGRVASSGTLEPRQPAGGFNLGANWPGLGLLALGAVLLLAGAAF